MRAFVRAALEDQVSSVGELSVVEASSGFDALRLLPRGPYALVITDINMPDINGLELVRFIRSNELHQKTPFADQPFEKVKGELKRLYVSRALGEAVSAFYQNARSRLQVTVLN